jgi:hypothetical protein
MGSTCFLWIEKWQEMAEILQGVHGFCFKDGKGGRRRAREKKKYLFN